MGRKKISGSHRKVDTARHRKRRKLERENRAIKDQERMMLEAEFTRRIQKEPSLKEIIERDGKSEE